MSPPSLTVATLLEQGFRARQGQESVENKKSGGARKKQIAHSRNVQDEVIPYVV